MHSRHATLLAASLILGSSFRLLAADASHWEARDLNPVTMKAAPKHAPIVLVAPDMTNASIVASGGDAAGPARALQQYIEAATGVKLPIVKKAVPPAIVLGDTPEALAAGLVGSNMPPEHFTIKTTADNLVLIVGHCAPNANGVEWGVCEFAERYLGMRWYFPPATEGGPEIGQDIPKTDRLAIPPVWMEDGPVFRMRVMWPPMAHPSNGTGVRLTPIQQFLRAGNSWPIQLKVHQPNWGRIKELTEKRPEVFQMKQDGSRQFAVLCYGNPKTLETYLEGVEQFLAGSKSPYTPIGASREITVSPADVELACYCDDCRKLWNPKGGQYGAASVVIATFTDKLAREIQKRWPKEGFSVIVLPYLNYTAAPEGIRFPGNVEVQICGMPGLATYKEPSIRDSEQANIDKWMAISGRKVQNWHYNCWPAHKTKAPYQYPHVVKDFYQRNRDKTVGTFINGEYNHWPRQHISLYCWLKCLWNPDYDVDAAVDQFCARMFGPAAGTMRKLVGVQIDRWENSRWPDALLSGKAIHDVSFPTNVVADMQALFSQAQAEAKDDPLVTARLDHYGAALKDFFEESKAMAGHGFKPLQAQKVGENPAIDGKLDEPAWERAPANTFVTATGKQQGAPVKYPTTLRALWTPDGITFGFHLTEPTPDRLDTRNGGHDNGEIWWDDNVELFLDVTGQRTGQFYQFIVNPDGNLWDSKMKDTNWECAGLKTKAFRGADFWSLEVFVPYAAFPEGEKPGSGTNTKWAGNFTRHRVADKGRSPQVEALPGSMREYQRMNTLGSTASDNLSDFVEIQFIE